ncbi:LOW QUALITY PROTEIN: centrosomal protein of 170 kDa protein B [Labeo rohita]|uniref:LOW QUALITY PROTEIN: centrosomal protein of 170 kDa protein B n=1 Tax=Labeo rohita TaxID=84645 RepID=UPI0021E2BC69|nr:LOW QUALITY PROTEIN: centrosomal protein of 170 kDa protein B [Labeo rohita]
MSVTSWFLVSSSGTRHRLPREMIFVGREDCELMLQSRSVDKQHAVINYNPATDEHLVKDLGSLNGTFVNDLRIPDQTYITLKLSDIVRFGYDSHVYILEKSQHKVPEEALKHEKYTSQLQMGIKSAESKQQNLQEERSKLERSERKSLTESPVPRPTPLYGQPSWWGEEDSGNKEAHSEVRRSGESHSDITKEAPTAEDEFTFSVQEIRDGQTKSTYPYHREPSYFEIPTKEFHMQSKSPATDLIDIPTKDTNIPLISTPPVVQSHASFTIEFDDCMPGKIKIKDHVTKFSSRQRSKQQQQPSNSLVVTPTEVLSAESKVADWLVQSDVSMMCRRPPCEDVYSTKSDLAMHIRTLKGHHHEDGTQSDSEDPERTMKGQRSKSHHSMKSQSSVQSHQSAQSKKSEPPESVLSQESASVQKFHHPQSVSPHKHHEGELDEIEVHPVQEASSPPQAEVKAIHPEPHTQQAFIIEFFDDNPRKKRSQSFTHNSAHADSYSALKAKLEKRKGLAHGERPASVHGHVPPTQQITVPLKGSSHGGSQRSSSLRREKTEDSGTSTSLLGTSSRSSPAITIKPFGSVGRKSKLAQEFTAEFLKDTEKTPPPMSAPPVMMSPSHTLLPSPAEPSGPSSVSYPPSPSQLPPLSQSLLQATSPVSVPSQAPGRGPVSSASPLCSAGSTVPQFSPLLVSGVETKASRVTRTEEEDSLSDAGTYTIETESQDKEVEKARSMIDQVFGVLDAPEYSGQTLGVYRPVIDDGKDEQQFLSHSHGMAADVISTSSQGRGGDQVISLQAHPDVGGPKWVSRWASLADTYSDPGATQGSMGIPPQSGPPDRDDSMTSLIGQSFDILESEGSQVSRTRRVLPQVPPGEKLENTTPSILIRHETNMDHEPPEKGSRAPQQQDCTQRLRVQDDVDPDSLSDTSRSDDSSILDRSGRSQARRGTHSPSDNVNHSRGLRELPTPTPKPTSFYIGSEDGSCKSDVSKSPGFSQPERDSSPKVPPTTVLIRHLSGHESRRPVKPNSSAPNLQTHNKDVVPTKETSTSFVRQESFTKDRPSDNIQVKKLPHISSHPALRSLDTEEAVRDTFPFPKEADKSLTSPEEKLPGSSQRSKKGSFPAQEDSLSGDSDVDTASTVSMVSNKNAPVSANKKHTSASDLRKEKSSSGLQDKARQPTARERLSEKRRNHASSDNTGKAELSRRLQLRRSAGNRGSLDLSDNQHGQQLWPEAAASDHESSSRPNSRKKLTAPLPKEDPSKMTKGNQQVLTRSNSLSAPRPTRASMLRRARLGEASDNEGAETDRASQSSDHSKTPAEGKKLSRLDILAMPRKRTRSFTVPSDNESTSSKHGISNRPTEANGSVRKGASSEVRQATSKGTASVGKHSAARTRSSQVKHSSTTGSHRRQKDSEYSSTSEEEFETNSNSKHKRSHTSASTQTQTPQKAIQMRLKCGSLETEEDETQNEHFQNWSTHSAEIARLSQDLAKDLAILAREIHDVAGDGDSQASSGMGATTSPGSMPNTPASTISTREERPYASLQRFLLPQLVQHIPEASLNYQKVPPGSTSPVDQDSNMNDHDSSRRRPWNREEVILDNLMLNPVSQLSQAIRENTEQLAEKMKALFHNKTEVWEEIEAKINAENEVPILKTSNKEISSILQELRRVQRQLEVINTIVEPGGILKIHPATSPGGKSQSHSKSASKEFTSPTPTNANASSKRGPKGPEGGRYVV